MPEEYFSDRELGPKQRDQQDITPRVWEGIVGVTELLIKKGAFGIDFPETHCSDGDWITGNDRNAFLIDVDLEIPDLDFSRRTVESVDEETLEVTVRAYAPPTPAVLDLLEFCHRHIARVDHKIFHSYFGHYHLDFDRETGQDSYRSQMNSIFARNGLAYELRRSGLVERLAPPVLRESLRAAVFQTGDKALDDLLEKARSKFLSHEPDIRRESLRELWGAWERLKSLDNPANKQLSIAAILDRVASESLFRAALETEAKELTRIGNNFQIRHTELDKPAILESAHVDYVFHRLFAFILLILGKR
jgi:hypothetical protein